MLHEVKKKEEKENHKRKLSVYEVIIVLNFSKEFFTLKTAKM